MSKLKHWCGFPALSARRSAQLLASLSRRLPSLALVIACTLLSPVSSSAATVKQPNGTLVESVEDLRIKVLGGSVAISRSWSVEDVATTGGKWYFNPAWADLKFTYDSLDGSVKSLRRLDAAYTKGGNGIFLFDKQDFIKAITAPDPMNAAKTIVTGWRWYNTRGNWITYNKDGRITAYGDRNNIQVSFETDTNGRPTIIKDHAGNTVMSFTYSGTQVSRITDRTGRNVQYTWVNNALTEVTDLLGYKTQYQYAAASLSGPVPADTTGQRADKNLTAIIDSEGRKTQFSYSGNRFDYDSKYNPLNITDEAGILTTYDDDGRGNLT